MPRRPPVKAHADLDPYTDDEAEFIRAMDRYKRERRRPYPTWSEVLAVARSLGYRKPPNPDPGAAT